MNSNLRTWALGATVITVPPSSALYLGQQAGVESSLLKFLSGGSIAIVSQTTTPVSGGYLLGAEALEIKGPAGFILAAGGATAQVMCLRGFTPGTLQSQV